MGCATFSRYVMCKRYSAELHSYAFLSIRYVFSTLLLFLRRKSTYDTLGRGDLFFLGRLQANPHLAAPLAMRYGFHGIPCIKET